MLHFEPLASSDDFGNGFYINWFETPAGRLEPGTGYTAGNNRYDFGDQVVELDVSGPPVELSICGPNGVRGQFRTGKPVVLAECDPNQKPLHVLFDPPVRAVGAFVGAEGIVGSIYDAVVHVHGDANGGGQGLHVRATLSIAHNTAPFLALRCREGALINEAWFDVLSTDASHQFSRVAISPLYYLP